MLQLLSVLFSCVSFSFDIRIFDSSSKSLKNIMIDGYLMLFCLNEVDRRWCTCDWWPYITRTIYEWDRIYPYYQMVRRASPNNKYVSLLIPTIGIHISQQEHQPKFKGVWMWIWKLSALWYHLNIQIKRENIVEFKINRWSPKNSKGNYFQPKQRWSGVIDDAAS